MPSAEVKAILKACASLEEVFSKEQASSGPGEELIKMKEKAMGELEGLLKAQGSPGALDKDEIDALSKVMQALYTGALSSARVADLKGRLSGNLARMLGHKPPSVTYNQAGGKTSGPEKRPGIDRIH